MLVSFWAKDDTLELKLLAINWLFKSCEGSNEFEKKKILYTF